jgi:hypothetical protein
MTAGKPPEREREREREKRWKEIRIQEILGYR